ncbi:hypothetical protein Taro_046366 [Colocasia esculenta]|uniref:Uncharacterized protein n=1 Tax=Colocasia esculenta TaxID=4460 RepID=A0A843X5G9_COLES|nr:hypothetical protein [Colocasia esculenta]
MALVNAAYGAVAFTGSVLESGRDRFELEELGQELERSLFSMNSPSLWLLPTSSKPLARARASHEGKTEDDTYTHEDGNDKE